MSEKELKRKEQVEHPTLRVVDAPHSQEQEQEPTEPSSSALEQSTQSPTHSDVTTDESHQFVPPNDPADRSTQPGLLLGLPNQELLGMAMHPNTPESEWLNACEELNRREQLPASGKIEKHPKINYGVPLVAAVIALALSAGAWFHFAHSPAKENSEAADKVVSPVKSPVKPTPYTIASAEYQSSWLQRRAQIAVANAIAENEWSDGQAASNLNASRQEIFDLMRDNPSQLSMEKLMEMLMIMGKSPGALNVDKKDWGFSNQPEPTQQQLRDAVAYYTRAISLGNNGDLVYSRRAYAHYELNEDELAIADYTRVIDMHGNSSALPGRAAVYRHTHNYQAALKDLNEFMRLSSAHDAYQERSLVYKAIGDYKSALKDCDEAIARMKTQRPGPYWNRALIEEHLGMYKEAIADCQKTLESDPTYTIAIEKAAALKKKLPGV